MFVLGLGACSGDSPEPAPVSTTSTSPANTNAAGRVDAVVTWPAVSEIEQSVVSRLSEASRRAVKRAPVPALVVDDSALLLDATVMSKPNWYAVSMRADGIVVSLHATRISHRYTHIAPLTPTGPMVRGQRSWVTQNESIWSVAWNENGADYSLEVECAEATDSRCTSDGYVLELASRLVFVGGSFEENRGDAAGVPR